MRRNNTWTEDVRIYAKARVEIQAKPGIPHDKTKDIEEIMAIIERDSELRCDAYESCKTNDAEDKDTQTTTFIIDVAYYKPCEFREEEGGEWDERIAEPIEDSLDYCYEGECDFETDELIISVIDIDDAETQYESY
jgi:hypothetical protein